MQNIKELQCSKKIILFQNPSISLLKTHGHRIKMNQHGTNNDFSLIKNNNVLNEGNGFF